MTMTTRVPPWALAVAAMASVQLGAALSVHLFPAVGTAGTAWLRLTMGAVIFLAIARPPLRSLRRRDLPALLALGAATAGVTLAFLAAIARIPLGTAVAIEFLGPLSVAALRSHSRRALVWPALALAGHGHASTGMQPCCTGGDPSQWEGWPREEVDAELCGTPSVDGSWGATSC